MGLLGLLGHALGDTGSVLGDGADFGPSGLSAGSHFTDATTITAVQSSLTSRGFDPGPIDGKFGPRTEAALSAFLLQATGAVVHGPPNGEALQLLGVPVPKMTAIRLPGITLKANLDDAIRAGAVDNSGTVNRFPDEPINVGKGSSLPIVGAAALGLAAALLLGGKPGRVPRRRRRAPARRARRRGRR